MRWVCVLLIACSREVREAKVDAAPTTSSAPIVIDSKLDDACKAHVDCVGVDLYVDGPLRCCVACGSQAAASKTSADRFIAACAKERATRECPVYDCDAEVLDPRCVGGHCQLAPRPR